MSPKLGIFNGFSKGPDSYELYVNACKELGVSYEVVDIISENWIENIRSSDCAGFLVRPTPYYVPWKQMYDERLYFVERSLDRVVYPSHAEVYLYENKRNMAYFLQAHNIPAPPTHIFYDLSEALAFLQNAPYPLVFKTHLGAQARGVEILRTRRQAESLVKQVFRRGYYRRVRTTLRGLLKHPIMIPYYFFDPEYKVVLLQEYIPNAIEWRMIRIGDSYFGHQKGQKGDYHSGSDLTNWRTPPERLLNFVKSICDTGGFWSMCVDIFEDATGRYHVNELQSIFGSYNPSQMYVNGVPGRYRYSEETKTWDFEEGFFNKNGSCNIRVEHLLDLLAKRQNTEERHTTVCTPYK